ncbi:MAG: epoxyqueuosine reductase QueH, partial [Bacteroidales bacterium]|nr:epoxyqueuosine reductase QueH [Bacteroidales bacterium]
HIKGLEDQPERGSRCLECFKLRMKKTAETAEKMGFDTIASSLSSSRWKSLEQIDTAGNLAVEGKENVAYLARNWRKGGLQQRRNELLKENGFYNQLYCGCEFSQR